MSDSEQATFGGLNIIEDVQHTNREAVVAHIDEVCEDLLPQESKTGDWPVSDGHCFRRLVYDAACEGVWYDSVDGDTFVDDADTALLRRAIRHAATMLYVGEDYAWRLQECSLLWRDEMDPEDAEYVDTEVVLG